jgi:manganese-dependent inorganic pyrophosphatase
MGYDVIDMFSKNLNLPYTSKNNGDYIKCKIEKKDVILLKPTTFMNLSGKALLEFINFFKIDKNNIIVIYDDKDLDVGTIRIRKNGSNGGHNGIKSIETITDKFIRVRIGIGKPKFKDYMINHVISKVSNDEYDKLKIGISKAYKAVIDILKYGVDISMNKNNLKSNKNNKQEKRKNNMDKIYITGHKNPDTDTIMSALVAEYLYTHLGYNVEAIKQGELNPETKFAIEKTGLRIPNTITKLTKNSKVILVDHNNPMESLENITELNITNIIDHHAIKLDLGSPTYVRTEPVGCTATILFKMFRENSIEIPKNIALAMLSAIISDSLLFKSPTCTDEDKKVASELEKIAGINKEEYGMEMLKAGTDLSSYSIEEILNIDRKTAVYGNYKASINQVMTADVEETLKLKEELEAGMQKMIENENLDLFMLLITDIINSDSTVIALGNKTEAVEKGYNVTLNNNMAVLKRSSF